MCTLALYFQQFEDYPLVIAANRDEFFTRPSEPPRILARKPVVLAGTDRVAGGTWLGVNEHGIVAGILNRRSNTKREKTAVRSRGLLCLDMLSAKNPEQARSLLDKEEGSSYQPFNLLIANAEAAFVGYNEGATISTYRLQKGLHVLSNTSIYDSRPQKIEHAYALFSSAGERFLAGQAIHSWLPSVKRALADHTLGSEFSDPKDAICVHTEAYGTVSSSLIFYTCLEKCFYAYYAPGPPCREDYGERLSLKVP
jgi:uncharacterized protein with NRDE domain